MVTRLALTALMVGLAMPLAGGAELEAFAYPDTAAAQAHWQPQFGSLPVRVERQPDGTSCLALDADFAAAKARACWDWVAPLDLSAAGRVCFEMAATNGGLAETILVYFGTPNGWYVGSVRPQVPAGWTACTLAVGGFGTEGTPDGWDKVTRFRFSVWSSGAGKATFRLRGFRVLPADPAENLLLNGSLEIAGAGMPYAWGSGHWGVGDLPWAADMDLWRRHWRLDTTVAKHGKASLCIENTPELPRLRAVSVWFTPPRTAATAVLSAWLKADREKLPVTLACGERSAAVEVGPEWTQAVLTGIPRGSQLLVSLAPKAPGRLWIDAVQFQAGAQATPDFHPAFEDEALARREAAVDGSPPRRDAATAAGRSVTGPVTAARAAIDGQGHFTLDGSPYLQHSFGLEFVSDLAVLDAVARCGFRDVCIQIHETVTTAQLEAIFDRCAAVGLRLIPWMDGRQSREQFREHITALRRHPALLCWYVYDEPSGERFAEADARVALAKELDPEHPAFVNYLPDRLENQTGDIYSTDVYPIPHGAPTDAIGAVRRMVAAATPERKPVWMWLQGTGYAYWMAREPTPRELSCMVYGSLLAGARGIYYFAQMPRTRECLAEMRALCVEVDAIAPALFSTDQAPALRCDRDAVMAKAFARGGEVWVLAVNTQAEPCQARFGLPAAVGTAEVCFEDRQVEARDNAWQDAFGPYERHVYRLAAGR